MRNNLLGALVASALTSLTAHANGTEIDFNAEIRPILSDNCFACHGPDAAARKARLRLDVRDEALKKRRGGGHAILPGKPDESSVVERIETKDELDLMPPPETGKALSKEQIAKVRRWIEAGAEWPEHWAYVKPERPEVPAVKNRAWVRNEIDAFVLARLEKEGLEPSPEADRTTLARRASLDLNGLPPTLEEVDAFLRDDSPNAEEKLVDRLLESKNYGEHQARYWLDAVRYADSHGYHIDARRDIWPYRDWVVDAFNANKPFDEFTIEQLAGDLLPDATTEQRIATGYLRCNMSTGEGGAIEDEYLAKYGFDRVETTGTVWLGMTLICARCHTHKYDPLRQTEYYSLIAFFNQLDGPVMDGNRPNPAPFIELPGKEQEERLAWLEEHLGDAEKRLGGPATRLDQNQAAWMQSWHERLRDDWTTLQPESFRSIVEGGSELKRLEDGSLIVGVPLPSRETYELTFKPGPGGLGALRLEALPNSAFPDATSGRASDGVFTLAEFEAEVIVPDPDGGDPETKPLKFSRALAESDRNEHEIERAIDGKLDTGWRIADEVKNRRTLALFLLPEPRELTKDTEIRVRLRFAEGREPTGMARLRLAAVRGKALLSLLSPLRLEPWMVLGPFESGGLQPGYKREYAPETELDLKAKYRGVREEIQWRERKDLADGGNHLFVNELHGVHGVFFFHRVIQAPTAVELAVSLRADDLFKLWLNGENVARRDTVREGVAERFTLRLEEGRNELLVKVVNHQGPKHFAFDHRPGGKDVLSPEVAAMLSSRASLPEPWQRPVRDFYRRTHSEEFAKLFNDVAGWREEKTAIAAAIPTTMVAKERAEKRDTFLLRRGEYDKPGERVAAGVPAILPPLAEALPDNRLGLAKWLISPDHPLTARVTVNRLWQRFFGVGLVKTAEDFGVQGERPSHPDLLDWLATEFVASSWDVRRLQRLIVASATYRQSARVTPELLARDPENRLLARGPRFRVDGEVIRDTMLEVSGLLVDQLGGPAVKPYEPPGLWEAVSYNNAQKYVPDRNKQQYRRSLYTYWKRQSPPPNMLIFDGATREYCVVRRPRTNTPLQALTLLNDPQFVEASRALACRMLTEGGDEIRDRLTHGFRLATSRRPTSSELDVLTGVLEAQLAEYRADADAANGLIQVGDFAAPAGLDTRELAAWTTVASLLLNLDETMTKG